jgi:hypothetical protein
MFGHNSRRRSKCGDLKYQINVVIKVLDLRRDRNRLVNESGETVVRIGRQLKLGNVVKQSDEAAYDNEGACKDHVRKYGISNSMNSIIQKGSNIEEWTMPSM